MVRLIVLLVATVGRAVVDAYDNRAPESRLPPLGWSSWVALAGSPCGHAFDYCSEKSVKAAADNFHTVGLYDAGYRHLHLDDCWAGTVNKTGHNGGRNATGFLEADRNLFPNGMKAVVDYVHSKNLTFGLYTCAGNFTCIGHRPGSGGPYDPVTGITHHVNYERDARTFAEWGVDYVKMDWCFTDGMVPNGPTGVYPAMSKALNDTGRPIHFNMCEWGLDDPWEWGGQYAQSWRVFGDHHGIWNVPGGTRDIINQSMYMPKQYTGRPYAWNDLDMLETGNGGWAKGSNQSDVEYRTEFSMWAILASPLVVTTPLTNMAGCDDVNCNGRCQDCRAQDKGAVINGKIHCPNGALPKNEHCSAKCAPMLTPLQQSILLNKDVIAINQDITPQGTPVVPGDSRVWSRELSDGSTAYAFVNLQDVNLTIPTKAVTISTESGTAAVGRVHELWTNVSYTIADFPKEVTVEPHATVLYRYYPGKQTEAPSRATASSTD